METRLKLFQLLSEKHDWVRILEKALEVEEEGKREADEKGYKYFGWEWWEVHAASATLNKMAIEEILNISYKSSKSTYYMIADPEVVREVLGIISQPKPAEEVAAMPEDLFSGIVGYDEIKGLLMQGIGAERSVHFLLSGQPASAKTMFLLDLAKLPNSYYCLGPTLTEAGLSDVLFSYQPKALVIDEVDRLRGIDLGVLNSLMATGIVSLTKYGKQRSMKLETKVFAAGINIDRLPRDFLSRFIKFRFPPYSRSEFVNVSQEVLAKEDISIDNSTLIAEIIWDMNQLNSDIRLCVSVARLSGNDPGRIREVINTLKKYGR